MKKLFFIFIMIIFIGFNLGEIQVKAASNLNAEQIEHLESLGFTQEEILNMLPEEINKNLEIDGEVVATSTKFLKVIESDTFNEEDLINLIIELDEETYFKEVQLQEEKQNRGFFSNKSIVTRNALHKKDIDKSTTSYKTVTTTIVALEAKKKYRVKTAITWHIMPKNRKIDVIGTSINSAFWAPTPGSQYGQQSWSVRHSCNKTKHLVKTYSSSSNSWTKGPTGYPLSIDLPDDIVKSYACHSEKVITLSAFSYFTVDRLTSTIPTQIDAFGKYLHQESNRKIFPNINFYPLSFGVSASQSSKFTEATTHAKVIF